MKPSGGYKVTSPPSTNAKIYLGYGLVDFRKAGYKGNKIEVFIGIIIVLSIIAVSIWFSQESRF